MTAATQTAPVSVVVLIDATGDYAVGRDEDEARAAYENEVQELAACEGFRLVKLSLTVPLPALIELAGAVPEAGGEITLTATN